MAREKRTVLVKVRDLTKVMSERPGPQLACLPWPDRPTPVSQGERGGGGGREGGRGGLGGK